MSAVYEYSFGTDPSTQFRGALAQNAGVDLDFLLPPTLQGINGTAWGTIKSLTIVSIQNLDWELWLWQSATHSTLTAAVTAAGSNWIGRWTFVAGDAVQKAGTGDFQYYIDGLDIPYFDADKAGKLHLTLLNRNAVSKLANDAGAVQVKGRIAQPVY